MKLVSGNSNHVIIPEGTHVYRDGGCTVTVIAPHDVTLGQWGEPLARLVLAQRRAHEGQGSLA